MYLTPKGCVTDRFEMLEYLRVYSAFESIYALLLNASYYFWYRF